jgi:hypothetical protein
MGLVQCNLSVLKKTMYSNIKSLEITVTPCVPNKTKCKTTKIPNNRIPV